jgi:tetratricopeptide (TPR) repeat protein
MADNSRIEELRRRVLADPASIAFAALAEEYRRSGNYPEAIETCRVGLQRHPSYISARVTLGRALLEMAQYGEARKELELVLKTAPENLAAIRGLAEIHERERSQPEPADVKPVPVPRQPLATASAVATAPPATIALVKKTAADAGVAQWSLPSKAADPLPVQQLAPVSTSPPAAPPPDPAIARLEQFLVAIRSARASSRISR